MPTWYEDAANETRKRFEAGASPLGTTVVGAILEPKLASSFANKVTGGQTEWTTKYRKDVYSSAKVHGALAASMTAVAVALGELPDTGEVDPCLSDVAGMIVHARLCGLCSTVESPRFNKVMTGVPCEEVAWSCTGAPAWVSEVRKLLAV